jgi:hypothetical protein
VKYAPKVSVSVIGGALAGGRILEGAEVRLSCRADANPDDLKYHWYINDEVVIGDYTTEMVSLGLILTEHYLALKGFYSREIILFSFLFFIFSDNS